MADKGKMVPSINKLLAAAPEDLQILALQTIKDEYDRYAREDFTTEEKRVFKIVEELGFNAAKSINEIILSFGH